MTTKRPRPYRLMWHISTGWRVHPAAFGNLANAIQQARRLQADRVYDVVQHETKWSRAGEAVS